MKQPDLISVTVRIPPSFKKRMKDLSTKTGMRLEKLYADALAAFLEEHKGKAA